MHSIRMVRRETKQSKIMLNGESLKTTKGSYLIILAKCPKVNSSRARFNGLADVAIRWRLL